MPFPTTWFKLDSSSVLLIAERLEFLSLNSAATINIIAISTRMSHILLLRVRSWNVVHAFYEQPRFRNFS